MIYDWIRSRIPAEIRHSVSRSRRDFRKWREVELLPLRIFFRKFMQVNPFWRLPRKEPGRLNLHLGCGTIDDSRFINIDGMPHGHVDLVHTLARLPQFDDNTVDLVYASHCLEHFNYSDCEAVLSEWYRVLKPGGTLRISVPDFDLLLKMYFENGNDPDVIVPNLLGGQDNRYNYHFNVFNRVNLGRLLRKAGFSTIRDWTYGQDEYAGMEDFSIYRRQVDGKLYPVSLNLDAVK